MMRGQRRCVLTATARSPDLPDLKGDPLDFGAEKIRRHWHIGRATGKVARGHGPPELAPPPTSVGWAGRVRPARRPRVRAPVQVVAVHRLLLGAGGGGYRRDEEAGAEEEGVVEDHRRPRRFFSLI